MTADPAGGFFCLPADLDFETARAYAEGRMGPCPVCGRPVALLLLDGHLAVHELRGDGAP